MTIKDLMAELDRAIFVLGKDLGETQNFIDIKSWEKEGYITPAEAETLYKYNRSIAR